MPVLILMRHAKAVDRMEAEDDFERGLTARGRNDAARAAAALEAAGLTAAHALVSPARRTRETWACIAGALGAARIYDPMALYHASTPMLERAVLDVLDEGAQSVVLVGHNPGIGGFVHALASGENMSAGLPYGWPTSAVAAYEVNRTKNRLSASERLMLFDPKAAS